MPIVPDEKDWTWVLDRVCPACGFDVRDMPPTEVAGHLRANAGRWRALLEHPAAAVRPTDDRWSALEYACHVRDVYRLYNLRLHLMLDEDDPRFPNWDQDASAVEDRYGEQDPVAVAAEIEAAGSTLADSFDRVTGEQWERTGERSDGARFTIDTFARYLLHDPVHHVGDVESGYAAIDAGA
jgi:DinB superfamily